MHLTKISALVQIQTNLTRDKEKAVKRIGFTAFSTSNSQMKMCYTDD